MPDRYYRETDPRDEEWWARSLDRECASCSLIFTVEERLAHLPYVFCPQCTNRIVDALDEKNTRTTTR